MIFHQPNNSLGNYSSNVRFYTTEKWDFHYHKNFELIYVVQGEVHCTVNNVAWTLEAGDFGLCLPYDIHAYMPGDSTRYWVLVFSEDYVRQFSKNVRGKTASIFPFRCRPTVKQFIDEQLIGSETHCSVYMLKACLYAICEEFSCATEFIETSNDKRQTFLTVTDYISQNYSGNITLNDIAQLLGYNYNYVSRYFHSVFNMSFHDFMNLYRLEAATQLLDETDKKITEIAFESGFQSVRSFNNCFRDQLGMSPSEYRKTSRKSEMS